jgi:hypothetical protein
MAFVSTKDPRSSPVLSPRQAKCIPSPLQLPAAVNAQIANRDFLLSSDNTPLVHFTNTASSPSGTGRSILGFSRNIGKKTTYGYETGPEDFNSLSNLLCNYYY